jgi:TP901-1 family phage major tail protein
MTPYNSGGLPLMTLADESNALLKLRAEAGYAPVGGLKVRSLALNASRLDLTDAVSAGRWRDILANGDLKRVALLGSGIFANSWTDARVRELFFAGAIRDWQIVLPDFGIIEAPAQITALEFSADRAGAVTFDMSLESAGPPTFRAIASAEARQ